MWIVSSLDLDEWINSPPDEDESKGDDLNFFLPPSTSKYEDANPVCITAVFYDVIAEA